MKSGLLSESGAETESGHWKVKEMIGAYFEDWEQDKKLSTRPTSKQWNKMH